MTAGWKPVYRDVLEGASLLMSYLEGDEISVRMVPDVTSEPLQSPGPHNVRSRYTHYVLLVPGEEAERAEELIRSYQEEEGGE